MSLSFRRTITGALLATALFGFCHSDGATLEIAIRHTHDGKPLVLDSMRYQTAGQKETFSVTRLSYLLSEFAFQDGNGDWQGSTGHAWIDLAKRRTTFVLADLPEKDYRAVRFKVGLNPETNSSDETSYPADHPLNPNLNQLHWSWQGEYIFLAVEGRYRTEKATDLSGFVYHLANNPNEITVSLPLKLALKAAARVELRFDLAALLNAPYPLSFTADGASSHSHEGDPIVRILRGNLPGAFSVTGVSASTNRHPAPSLKPLYLPKSFTPFRFRTSRKFPLPNLPGDNPLTEERVALGKMLFHETRLSRTGEVSCSSCHLESHGFSDPRSVSLGVEGRQGTRNAMTLFNLAWKTGGFLWDGRAKTLREQALLPIKDHAEMDETIDNVIRKLKADPGYVSGFAAAFDPPGITAEKIGLAIEAFVLTLSSFNSKFDRAMKGTSALTEQEQRGFRLFFTEFEPRSGQLGADCFHCHGGALFTDHGFHDNGLAPGKDIGLGAITGKEADRRKFSTPSLRNNSRTAPYMHDGSIQTLEQVVEHYSTGVHRSETLDPNLAKHPAKGLGLSSEDKAALVAFLKTL